MKGGNAAKRSDPIEKQTIAATAGNVDTSLTPGAGKRWKIKRGSLTLTTDGTVADRYILLRITDGTHVTEVICYTEKVIASKTAYLHFGCARVVNGVTLGNLGGDVSNYVGVAPLEIEGDGTLDIIVSAGVVGDSYNGYVEVEECSIS